MNDTWEASIKLELCARNGRTVLTENEHHGPLVVQKVFYPEETAHLYLLHPPGGIAGCDKLCTNIIANECSKLLLTTPGATKFYRTVDVQLSHVSQDFYVAPQAELEVLPQANIYFLGTHTKVLTNIHVCVGGKFIFWDMAIVGNVVKGSDFLDSYFLNSINVFLVTRPNEERLLLREVTRIDGNTDLRAQIGLRGKQCIGTMLVTVQSEHELEVVRTILLVHKKVEAGITLIDGILVIRLLAQSNEELELALKAVWEALRPIVFKKVAVYPRVWCT